ncbi:MAG: aminoacyl-tRNA hydrolase [Lentisphaerae bacterium]|nr:aminoacyl-tRNA hydrolase [Lentisphaerota bacterium]
MTRLGEAATAELGVGTKPCEALWRSTVSNPEMTVSDYSVAYDYDMWGRLNQISGKEKDHLPGFLESEVVKLIVGLGNPGKEYEHTPHNVGFAVIDALAERCGCALRRSFRFHARLARTMLDTEKLLLVKPGGYMNRSGPVVAALTRSLGISLSEVLIILDDADLPLGRLRIRVGGGGGGHKGLLSILEHLGQDQFARLRLGIGRRENPAGHGAGTDLVAHVLKPFAAELRDTVRAMVARAADAALYLVANGAPAAMNKFNA